MLLIAGLGNPGKKYEKTRHNVGFDTLDLLAGKHGIEMKKRQCLALTGSGMIGGVKVLLVKPQTYMNLSGDSIASLLLYYGLDAEQDLIVISDDISLDPGALRIRAKGSAGGHNGLKNIIDRIGTDHFARVRIGVGAKPAEWDLADFVLGRFSDDERKEADKACEEACEAIELMVSGQMQEAMNRFNRKKQVES